MNRALIITGAALVGSLAAGAALFGGRETIDDSGDPARKQIVYVCTETGAVSTGRPEELPALNPATGRKTLMPGLYCAKCRKWHPAAPFDVAQRNPASRLCPRHRIPMEPNGPLPAQP